MTVRAWLTAGLTALGMIGAAPVHAADYDGALPGEGFDGMFGCIYARVDGGFAMPNRPRVMQYQVQGYDPQFGFSDGVSTGYSEAINEKISEHGFVEGGLGCDLSTDLRVEVTGGYRMKSTLSDPYPNSLSAEVETYTAFVNAYWDITNYAGFTPYIGGGIGVASHQMTNVTAPVGAGNGSNYDFAWNVTAGLAYDITPNLTFDVAYRFTDLGMVESGTNFAHAPNLGPMAIEAYETHEVKIGLRYHFGVNH